MISTPSNNNSGIFSNKTTDYINKTVNDLAHALDRVGIVWPRQEIEVYICRHMPENAHNLVNEEKLKAESAAIRRSFENREDAAAKRPTTLISPRVQVLPLVVDKIKRKTKVLKQHDSKPISTKRVAGSKRRRVPSGHYAAYR